jgi:hypothetical protein
MSLRERYRKELGAAAAAKPESSPHDVALVKLRAFAGALPAELEAMGITPFEVELFEGEGELRLDTGPCMIVVRVTEAGGYRTRYELKRPDDYAETEVPEAASIDELEAAIARILAQRA